MLYSIIVLFWSSQKPSEKYQYYHYFQIKETEAQITTNSIIGKIIAGVETSHFKSELSELWKIFI